MDAFKSNSSDSIFCISDGEYDFYNSQGGIFSADFPIIKTLPYQASQLTINYSSSTSSELVIEKLRGRIIKTYHGSFLVEREDGSEEKISYTESISLPTIKTFPDGILPGIKVGAEVELLIDDVLFSIYGYSVLPAGTLKFSKPLDIDSRIANARALSKHDYYLYFNTQATLMFIDPDGFYMTLTGHNVQGSRDLLSTIQYSIIAGATSNQKDLIRGIQSIKISGMQPGIWAVKVVPFPYSDLSSTIKIDDWIDRTSLKELNGKFLFFRVN